MIPKTVSKYLGSVETVNVTRKSYVHAALGCDTLQGRVIIRLTFLLSLELRFYGCCHPCFFNIGKYLMI